MTGVPVIGIDHIRFVVGNARQSAYFYRNAFGFDVIGYAGLETGMRQESGYVLRQGNIILVLTSPLKPGHQYNNRLSLHGDGVADLAFSVENVEQAYIDALKAGAVGVRAPEASRDAHGSVEYAVIKSYGDTTHTLINRSEYSGLFMPGYQPIEPERYTSETSGRVGLKEIDHIFGNVEAGQMNRWIEFYENVMGFDSILAFDKREIQTQKTALHSRVVRSKNGKVTLPINEPAASNRRSQVDEFLDFYSGPGVQHIALTTDDIIATVEALKQNNVSFLPVPEKYYDNLEKRVGSLSIEISDLKRLGIVADRDTNGCLLQTFTKPVSDRPTVFFEIIQREGATTFGQQNFTALFEAIEKEQAARGTL